MLCYALCLDSVHQKRSLLWFSIWLVLRMRRKRRRPVFYRLALVTDPIALSSGKFSWQVRQRYGLQRLGSATFFAAGCPQGKRPKRPEVNSLCRKEVYKIQLHIYRAVHFGCLFIHCSASGSPFTKVRDVCTTSYLRTSDLQLQGLLTGLEF